MALDLGDAPDWIDPEKKRRIQRNEHPYAQNPAFPQQKPARRSGAPYKNPDNPAQPEPTQHYGELITSHVYPEIIRKVHQYTGEHPRQTGKPMLQMKMMQALMRAIQLERPHRQELEQAAVEICLNLPEFRDARAAIQAGHLRIDAHLVDPPQMAQVGDRRGDEQEAAADRMQNEPEEPDEQQAQELGLHVPEIQQEFSAEADKRRFVNMLIQGAAINKNYAYHEIADRLRQIDPNILQTYGTAMSIAELCYWTEPEEQLNMVSGGGAGGIEEIDNEDGVWVVRAYAIVFPVLIQEITKGLYEFLAHNEDDPEDVRKYTYGKVDTLGNEQWDIMKGPGVWRHLNHIVNSLGGAEYMGRIFRHLVTLPSGEFSQLMREILQEAPGGSDYIRRIIAEIRAEEGQNESQSKRIIRQTPD